MYITCEDLPLQKTIFCLATLRSRLLMHGSAVRGLRLIATSRRGARDLSCLHGGDCAARKVRASASEVKGGGGYGHPLSASPRPEYVIIPRWFTVHHMRGGTLSEAGEVGPMNAVRRPTAARPLERARARSSWAIAAPWLRTR